jgi:peptidoglycan/LPS O-acetylase OafA/YrhL
MNQEINRNNNFDLLRLIAALQVFYGHAVWHLEIKSRISTIFYFPGVLIFFTISGFLIFQSLERNKNINQYFINRIIRIYPALLVCFTITIILLLFFQIISFKSLASVTILKWIITQITVFQFWTPDVLRVWGVGTPNGSLWTIPVEIQFYLLLPILIFTLTKIKLIYKFTILIILSIGANIILRKLELKDTENILVKLFGVSIFPYLSYFLIGSILSLKWQYVKRIIEGKAIVWIITFFVFIYIFKVYPEYKPINFYGFIVNILLSICTISFTHSMPRLSNILRGHDISYGIYIYHLLVLNTFVHLGYTKNLTYLILSLVITIALAIFSWTIIEKKALSYKLYLYERFH